MTTAAKKVAVKARSLSKRMQILLILFLISMNYKCFSSAQGESSVSEEMLLGNKGYVVEDGALIKLVPVQKTLLW